jgi:carbon storage regulator
MIGLPRTFPGYNSRLPSIDVPRAGGLAVLILNREKYQSVVIGKQITVTVLKIHRDKVWLAVVVPKNIPVHRQEVYDAIHGRSAALAASANFTMPQADVGDLQPDFVVECRIVGDSKG